MEMMMLVSSLSSSLHELCSPLVPTTLSQLTWTETIGTTWPMMPVAPTLWIYIPSLQDDLLPSKVRPVTNLETLSQNPTMLPK